MRRLFAGLMAIAVAAAVLAWFAQGVAVGEDPGQPDDPSWEVITLQKPEGLKVLGEAAISQLVPQDKYEDFEGDWPNDWQVLSTHDKGWGPNKCLAYDGSYSGWVEAWGPGGHPSHTDSPACTSPTGYNDNFQSWMVYGPFSLEGKTGGGVSEMVLLDTELDHDVCVLAASTDGENFSGMAVSGDSGGWQPLPPEYGDFSDWPGLGNILGEPEVWVAGIFQSDASHTGAADMGCFVDNINIESDGVCDPVVPGTYTGAVTLEGAPCPDGTVISASINGIEWSSTTCSGGGYIMDIPDPLPTEPPCFPKDPPRPITFTAGGLTCTPSPEWSSGLHENVNLICGEGCPMCGDVNCDEIVNAVDAMFILQYVVGLRDQLCDPCCPGP